MCRISQNSNLANANHCSNYQAEKKMNVKGEKKRSNNAIIPKSQVFAKCEQQLVKTHQTFSNH
jgi:hypothetical protein